MTREEADGMAIVSALAGLARGLNMISIAEGVEDRQPAGRAARGRRRLRPGRSVRGGPARRPNCASPARWPPGPISLAGRLLADPSRDSVRRRPRPAG
ncbi:MAG: hypothetical protein MZV49_01115 [Rhodopseudomonas palustris]|nr:hypothetical protein [Rhodopseudomonas palustris]